jgi:hypothetical protein
MTMHRLIATLALAAASIAPASAEVVQAGEGSFVLRFTATVAAAQDEVWKQVLRPADWWSSDHTFSGDAANLWLDGQATGCFCEKLPRPADLAEGLRSGSAEHLRVLYVEPPRALRLSGGLGPLQSEPVNGVMTLTLRSAAGRTRIALEYVVSGLVRRKGEEMAPLVDKVLAEQVARLAGKFPPVEQPAASGAPEAQSPSPEAPLPETPPESAPQEEEAPPAAASAEGR